MKLLTNTKFLFLSSKPVVGKTDSELLMNDFQLCGNLSHLSEILINTKSGHQYWKPETVLIEAKAAGLPLIFELRRMGIPVADFTPNRGNDKHARVNSVAPLFESGRIFAPKNREFAQERSNIKFGQPDICHFFKPKNFFRGVMRGFIIMSME